MNGARIPSNRGASAAAFYGGPQPGGATNLAEFRKRDNPGLAAACTTLMLIGKERCTMKLSARNILRGKIVDVIKGQTTAHVRIDVNGTIVTASITNEAVDQLDLKKGMSAAAVVKASDVMVAVD